MAKLLKELKYLHNRVIKPADKYVEKSCVRYINIDDDNDHVNEIFESTNKITVGRTAEEIISGAVEDVTVTFTCATEGATILINGSARADNKITVDKGSTVSYSASKDHHRTVSGTVVADSTKTVAIPALTETCIVNITTEPADATVTLTYGGQTYTSKTATVDKNTSVDVEVSKEGYQTHTETKVVDTDWYKIVTLDPVP